MKYKVILSLESGNEPNIRREDVFVAEVDSEEYASLNLCLRNCNQVTPLRSICIHDEDDNLYYEPLITYCPLLNKNRVDDDR